MDDKVSHFFFWFGAVPILIGIVFALLSMYLLKRQQRKDRKKDATSNKLQTYDSQRFRW